MLVAGLDLSLTASGVAAVDGKVTVQRPPKSVGMEVDARIVWLRDRIADLLYLDAPAFPHLVVVEGFSYGAQNGREVAGGVGYAVRCLLYECHTPYVNVAPTALKKFFTGNSRAHKDEMLATAIRVGYEGSSNDGADAFAARQLGLYAHGCSQLGTTKYREEVLAKLGPMLDTALV